MDSNESYQYFRVTAKRSPDNGWEAYYKSIEFYDSNGRVLSGGSATCLKGDSVNASYAFDGNSGTKYRTENNPGGVKDWITYKHTHPVTINRVRIEQFGSACNHVQALEVHGSIDGNSWKLLLDVDDCPIVTLDTNVDKVKSNRMNTSSSSSADSSSIKHVTNYQKRIAGGSKCTLFLGSKVCLCIDDDAKINYTSGKDYCLEIVRLTEKLCNRYIEIVGFTPQGEDSFIRPFRIEVAFFNAGGLASHGVYGIAIGPAYLQETYDRVSKGEEMLHQIFFYEMFRNFVNPPVFTPAFDYAVKTSKDSWGWVNQGFVNMTGCLLAEGLGITFDYYGNTRDMFRQNMEKEVNTYIERGESWSSCLGKHHLVPWDQYKSIDNIWSGVLSMLFDMCGGDQFLQNLFKQAHSLGRQRGSNYDKSDQESAKKNFIKAVKSATCTGNTAELDDLFNSKLRFFD